MPGDERASLGQTAYKRQLAYQHTRHQAGATRKFVVEPVFGQIKQARGFRQFLLRGLEKVRGEWALICMTHNIRQSSVKKRKLEKELSKLQHQLNGVRAAAKALGAGTQFILVRRRCARR